MRHLLILLVFSLLISGFSGCNEESKVVDIPDNAPESYGTVLTIDKETRKIELDITQWAKENGYIAAENKTDLGKLDRLTISEGTLIRFENREKASIENIKENQKLKVLKNENGEVTELILLEE